MSALKQAPKTAAPIELRASDAGLAEAIVTALRDVGAAVVHGVAVGDDDALLGTVAHAATPSPIGNGGGLIYDVIPRPESEQVDVSSTDRSFPLHTDSTYLRPPHHVVALGCLDAPEGCGGESHLLDIHVVVGQLRESLDGNDALMALGEPAYPFAVEADSGERFIAQLAILDGDGGEARVRYRGDLITEAGRAASIAVDGRHRAALDRFDATLGDVALHAVLALRPSDVLLVDNHRMLHGRTAISPGTHRLMRRVKAFI